MSVFFCLQIWLHALLDTCNAYGTGLFEPFSHQRFSFHLLFVADPFFSLSIVITFVALSILRINHCTRRRWLFAGLIPAATYLLYTIFNKVSIDNKIEQSLSAEHIPYKNVMITPTPFNSLLWYVIAAVDSGYFVGYRSVFDKDILTTSFTYFQKNEDLLQKVDKATDIKQLIQFADNYYTLQQTRDTLVFNVLRFGQVAGWENPKEDFVFQYFLNSYYNNTLVVQRGRFRGWNKKSLISMFNRIKGKN
jgi:inner membrane protein